jgi:hypothetical protein
MVKIPKYLIGFLGSVAFALGVTFKLLHLPGANQLYIVGFLVVLLVFIPLYAIEKYKSDFSNALSERWKIILGGAASVIAGISGIFKLLHLQGADLLLLLGTFVFIVGFLPLFFYSLYKNSTSQEDH